jgi:hypothetical protein
MKNLEQIRAANALAYAEADVNTRGSQGGEVVKKLPALIMSNGLLAAAAFAYQKQSDELNRQRKRFKKERGRLPTPDEEHTFQDSGYYTCFDYLVRHLQNPEIALVPKDVPEPDRSDPRLRQLDVLLGFLTSDKASSHDLKLITEEALAWLTYARRFVRKESESKEGDSHDSDES